MRPIPKTYIYGDEEMTFAQAKARFPHLLLMERATMRDTREECERVLLRNIEEMRRILNNMEDMARGNYVGTLRKDSLVHDANMLHKWRIGMNISSGFAGSPHLWQT